MMGQKMKVYPTNVSFAFFFTDKNYIEYFVYKFFFNTEGFKICFKYKVKIFKSNWIKVSQKTAEH